MVGYEFPAGALDASSSPDGILTRVAGTLALPATPGPHPVVVIVHGSYPQCIWGAKDPLLAGPLQTVAWPERCGTHEKANAEVSEGTDYVKWDASVAHLTRQLAERGMVAVALDVSAKDTLEFGEANPYLATEKLLDLHRGLLKDFHAGQDHGLGLPASVKGSMDFSRVGYVGHSSGGEYLANALEEGTEGMAAVALLQPVLHTSEGEPFARPVPTLIVSGQCDEQANPQDIAQAAPHVARRNVGAPTVTAVAAGTTHIAMLGGGNHTSGLVNPVKGPQCAADALVPAGQARPAAAIVVADFLQQAFAGSTDFTLGASKDAPMTVASLSPGATATTEARELPQDLRADEVTYLTSTHRALPAFTGKRVELRG